MIKEPPHSKEKEPKYSKQSTQMVTKQVYTNVNPNDEDSNGQTLTLNVDHTFQLRSRNYAWDSHDHFTWSSYFSIDGTWLFDKELRRITLTATKFGASLQVPLKNQQEEFAKAFPNRVISTQNFDIKQSKEIKCFVISWNYDKFKSVTEGILRRT